MVCGGHARETGRVRKKLKEIFWWLFLLSFPFQLGKHFWPSWSFILGRKIDYLSLVIYFSDLLLLFCFLTEEKKIFRFDKKIIFLILLNIIFSFHRLVSFLGWLKLAKIFLVAWLIKRNKKFVNSYLCQIISFWVIVETVLVLAQWWRQASLNGWAWWLGERRFDLATLGVAKFIWRGRVYLRPYGTFSHPNSLAGFLLVSLIIFQQKARRSWWSRLILILGSLCLCLTLSRTVLLVGGIYLIWLSGSRWWSYLLLILEALFLFYFFPSFLAFRERWQLFQVAGKILFHFPLTGVGWDNFLLILPSWWPFGRWPKIVLQPVHNIFLLLLVQTGLGGIFLLKKIFWAWRKRKKAIFPLAAILLTGMADHYWLTLPQNLLLLGLVGGLF